jgi:uncharacterized membrane protein YphA (DoxX/SURF4 family)
VWTSRRPWLGTLSRVVLGVVLLWSGWVKLNDPRAFLRAVLAYELTPNWLGKAIAYGLPLLLLFLGLMIVVGVVTRLASAVAAVLLALFLIATVVAAVRSLKLTCPCFGDGGVTEGSTAYLLDILLILVLLAAAVFLVLWPLTRISVDEFLSRNDHVEMPSAKRMRTEGGRRKYETELAMRTHNARSRTLYLTSSVAILVVLITVISMGVQAKRSKITATASPVNATVINGVIVGNNAAIVIDIYEDFSSSASRKFADATRADLATMVAASKVQVRYHPVAVLDRDTDGNKYSSRAANASICAADFKVEAFQKYRDYLFGVDGNGKRIQPAVGSHGRTDTSLITYAKESLGIGLTDLSTFQTCVQGDQYGAFISEVTNHFTNESYNDVPQVLVNGKLLSTLTQSALDKAIAAAPARKFTPTPPVVTPTPTASGSAAAPVTPSASAAATPSASP